MGKKGKAAFKLLTTSKKPCIGKVLTFDCWLEFSISYMSLHRSASSKFQKFFFTNEDSILEAGTMLLST